MGFEWITLISLALAVFVFLIFKVLDLKTRPREYASTSFLTYAHPFIEQSVCGIFLMAASFFFFLLTAFNRTDDPYMWIVLGFCGALLVGSLVGILLLIAPRTDIPLAGQDYFYVRTVFFKKHRISYEDCVGYRNYRSECKLKTEERTWTVGVHGKETMLIALLEAHGVKEIHPVKKQKRG